MEAVTLEQVLEARDARVERQNALLKRYSSPLISFCMNIPGPVKDTPLIRRAFLVGRDALSGAMDRELFRVLKAEERLADTGCEYLCAVKGDALAVKRLCVQIEDANALGRLFDMDVLMPDGTKLERDAVEGGERNCIVCGARGRGCASRRVHSVEELQAAARRIMTEHFRSADRIDIAEKVTQALLEEVYTTPKPGLVDRESVV